MKADISSTLLGLRGDKPRKEVAKDLKISYSTLAMYESGERTPRDDIKKRIAKYYKTTVEAIFFR